MIGGGAILLYIAVILAVVPVGEGDSARATALCVITPWFTAIGYSLCYGTILVKMFRTWYIFNKPIANKKEVCIMNVHNSFIMMISSSSTDGSRYPTKWMWQMLGSSPLFGGNGHHFYCVKVLSSTTPSCNNQGLLCGD